MKNYCINNRVEWIQQQLNESDDVIVKNCKLFNVKLAVIYIKNFANQKIINEGIINAISKNIRKRKNIKIIDQLNDILAVGSCEKITTKKDAISTILHGDVLIVIDQEKNFLEIKAENAPQRTVEEPPTSIVVSGPREGFVESANTNLALLRKRIVHKDFVVKELRVGRYTKTKIQVCYINSIAENKIVKKILKKIKEINIDGIIDSYYLVEFLEEYKNSMFSQVGKTEKPDVVCAKILEGRIAIIVDGSPVVLTIPYLLLEDYQSGDDYYGKNYKVLIVRNLRVFGVLVAILLPGFYVASQLYHYKALPLEFLITIMNTTQGLPFTPFIEVLFVIFLFEVLYESSLRMPRYLGMALSIVGALILGDTAVKAGLISSPAVMIVALSGITIYMIPQQAGQLTILRILFVFAGGIFGFFGIISGSLFVVAYLSSLNCYDTPYLAPFAPHIANDKQDGIFKDDLVDIKNRPRSIPNVNSTREVGKK